ncbi:MAG: hypothetical protein RLZZ230_737 [Candidatus Parcubacteria bacterium]|jgi:succinyl-diaminopimelate desuccinylase
MKFKTSKEQIIELTKALLAFESTESNVKEQHACIDLLEKKFCNDFFITRHEFLGRPALVMSTTKKKMVKVIFSGHIDVVPGKKSLFKPTVKGSKLFGRGSYDMKAGVVASIYAAVDYRKNGGTKDVAIMLTSDEETSGYSSRMLLQEKGYRAEFAFLPDGGTDVGIVLKQKGFMQIKVTVNGKSAHAAYVWEGDNALTKVLRLQEAIKEAFHDPDENEQWRTSVVLSKVETSNSLNQVPGSATSYFDIRYINNKDPRIIISLIKKILGSKSTVEVLVENGMFASKENNHYVKTLASILHKKTKKPISFVNENGTSDAIFFTEHGIPAALYRPKGGDQHQDGEWVDINSLFDMYEVLFQFLENC